MVSVTSQVLQTFDKGSKCVFFVIKNNLLLDAMIYTLISFCFVLLEKDYASIHALKVDVTKDEEVNAASTAVSKWLNDSTNGKTRILHAVINNAGIGIAGLVDWNSLSNYQKVMEGEFSMFLLYFFISCMPMSILFFFF